MILVIKPSLLFALAMCCLIQSSVVFANYAVIEQHFSEKDCKGEVVFQTADVQATMDVVNSNTTSYVEPYLCSNLDHNQSSKARVLTHGNWYFYKTANATILKDVESESDYFGKSCQLIREDFWNCTNGEEEILIMKVPDIPWMYYLAGAAVVMAANASGRAHAIGMCCQATTDAVSDNGGFA